MKFNLKVTYLDGSSKEIWNEDYNRPEVKTEAAAREWGERTIKKFNDTLRPHEKARKLVDVTFEDNDAKAAHEWQKVNLVTLLDNRLDCYDQMICLACNVTARRYGLDHYVLDKKFKKKHNPSFCKEAN